METPILKAWKKCRKDCTVRSAQVACIATAPDYISITVNKRGSGGGVSDWTHHAEELMCRKIKHERWPYPGEVNITVVRFRKDGSLACARPCIMCDKYLRKTGVRHVWYTQDDGSLARLW